MFQSKLPVDDNVNLSCSSSHCQFDLLKSGGQWVLSTWEPSGHCCYWYLLCLVPGLQTLVTFRCNQQLYFLSSWTHSETLFGYTQTAPVVKRASVISIASIRSFLTGLAALRHSLETFVSVSSPERVVRSIIKASKS